ncbi:COPII coat Sec23p-Sfb3p heterodimer component [Basidiobolus ranarum]|uniref:COPII coat Sec23p-Sfb3p heterodimer component n=1 Tax=Basidiobolus ranarum TaxID=34480 RepID=A0ABR2WBL5_9FUNG
MSSMDPQQQPYNHPYPHGDSHSNQGRPVHSNPPRPQNYNPASNPGANAMRPSAHHVDQRPHSLAPGMRPPGNRPPVPGNLGHLPPGQRPMMAPHPNASNVQRPPGNGIPPPGSLQRPQPGAIPTLPHDGINSLPRPAHHSNGMNQPGRPAVGSSGVPPSQHAPQPHGNQPFPGQGLPRPSNPGDQLSNQMGNLNLQQNQYFEQHSAGRPAARPKRVFLGPDGNPVNPAGFPATQPPQNAAPNSLNSQQAPSLYSPMGGQPQQPNPMMPGFRPTTNQQTMPLQPQQQPQSMMRPPNQPPLASVGRPAMENPPRNRIDPDQIPSPITVQEQNQKNFVDAPFMTYSRTSIPLASSNFKAIDEGCSNPRFMRMTMYNVPATTDLLQNSHLPLGMIVQPLAELRNDEAPLELVDFGESGPIRCNRCQAYINPFVTFVDGGRKFVCNLCQFANEVPEEYFCNLDMNGRRLDIETRPELRFGSVEFVATKDYCNRPPVPASFIFAIDVSWNSIQSGMLHSCIQAVREAIYSDKGIEPGIRVGIMTYDRSVHFYNLSSNLEQAQMMVVPDVFDMFVPLNEGFFVDPLESRDIIESLLESLPTMFANNRIVEPVLGAAMQSAYMALKDAGGKVFVFHTTLPIFGPGSLKNRDDVKIIGTDKENALYSPQETFYKTLATDMVESGISVDMFLFPNSYVDVATIGTLASLTGGDIHFYSNFDPQKEGMKFTRELQHNVTRKFGFNGIMRVRCSNGFSLDDHFGNFYMRNATDVEFGGLDSDKGIAVLLKHDSKVDEKTDATFQCALLYTTSTGQRRIRLHNLSVPVTTLMGNMFRYAEMDATINLLSKQAIAQSLSSPLRVIKEKLTEKCVHILAAYRKHCASSTSPGQLILPEALKLFPLYALTILKSRALRNGVDISIDSRRAFMSFLNSVGVSQSIPLLYPRLIPLHTLPENTCVPNEHDIICMPPMIRDSYARLDLTGAYLVDNSLTLMLWVGNQISQEFLEQVFGVSTLQEINPKVGELPELDNPTSHQIRTLMKVLQQEKVRYPNLQIVRHQMDQAELEFSNLMVEDKNNDNMSYVDYLCFIHRQIQNELTDMSDL